MLYKTHNLIKFFISITIIISSTVALADTQQPSKIPGFAFDVSPKMPSQGMLYGPLNKNSLYQVTCQIKQGNTDKKISMKICHEGKSDDHNICGKDSKTIAIKLSQDKPNNEFTFKNLKPITLNKKWREGLSADYIIMLSTKAATTFKEGEYLTGNCNIEKQAELPAK